MTWSLRNFVCLVTGGAQGIGWAITQALADGGARVHACDISAENLAHAARQLESLPFSGRVVLSPCDVADREQVSRWIAEVERKEGRIDVLVNNAAFVRWQCVAEMSVEDAERTMDVGYRGMVYTVKAVLPRMSRAGRGHIVNIGSVAGCIHLQRAQAAYDASKAAIDAYTQILQIELHGSPICVTLVRPGAVAGTDLFRKHVVSSQLPRMTDFLPYVTPPVVADAVVEALRTKRPVVNIPGYIGAMQVLFAAVPNALRRIVRLGGGARRDYGQVEWCYSPKQER